MTQNPQELNPETVSLDGLHVIEAGAGTGKTYTITKLYRRLILEGKAEVSQILVVTFTEAATKELRTRLQKELEECRASLNEPADPRHQRCRKALADFDNAPIFTIHGFCRRMLLDHAFESGLRYNLELVGTPDALLQEILQDFYRKLIYGNQGPRLRLWKKLGLTLETLKKKVSDLLGKKNLDWPEGCQLPESLEEELQGREEELQGREGGTDDEETRRSSYKSLVFRAALAYGEKELARRKQEKGLLTYDDLLTEMARSLQDPQKGETFREAIRRQFRYVFVDEFQDTDDIQNSIFTQAFREDGLTNREARGIFLIGDPKQAIYAFRSGDVYTYLDATQEGEKHQLTNNWRSSPEFIRTLNAMRGKREDFFARKEIPFPEIQSPDRQGQDPHLYQGGKVVNDSDYLLTYSICGSKDYAFKQMGKEIEAMVTGGSLSLPAEDGGRRPITYSDIAVLCVNNADVANAAKILLCQGIPCVIYKSSPLFDTQEAKDIQRLLQAIRSPGDLSLGKSLLLTPFFPRFDATQLRFLVQQSLPLSQKLRKLQETWQKASFQAMFSQFLYAPLKEYLGEIPLKDLGWDPKMSLARILQKNNGNAQSLAICLQIQDVLAQAALSQRLGLEGLTKFLEKRITNAKQREEEEKYPLFLTTEESAVRLLTIHKSKGLQFPIVYVQGMLSKAPKGSCRYHTQKEGKWEIRHDMTGEHLTEIQKEEIQENLRLFYVAVTRAKFLCRLLEGSGSKLNNESLYGTLKLGTNDKQEELLHSLDVRKATDKDKDKEKDKDTKTFLDWLKGGEEDTILTASRSSSSDAYPPEAADFPKDLPVPRGWQSCSFSNMSKINDAKNSSEDPQEKAAQSDEEDNRPDVTGTEEAIPKAEDPIFRFPRGARAGICWHEILEGLDFTRPAAEQKPFWLTTLESYAQFPLHLSPEERKLRENAFQEMLDGLRETPLPNPEGSKDRPAFSLKDIDPAQRHSEFHFAYRLPDNPLLKLAHDKLKDLESDVKLTPFSSSFPQERWILNGCIDLLFQAPEPENRFFIVDWKTNVLNGTRDGFRREGMEEEMKRNQYDLQYVLYTVAFLHAYQQHTPGWQLTRDSYDALFGGVIFCFLRGIRKGQQDDHGFYAIRPEFDKIQRLFEALPPFHFQASPPLFLYD